MAAGEFAASTCRVTMRRGPSSDLKEHFGDPVKGVVTAEHAKLAAYFNLDNGSGRIRGVYLQGNDAARPFFRSEGTFRRPGEGRGHRRTREAGSLFQSRQWQRANSRRLPAG